ncbi:hypothetical protein B0T26DRAFT_788870 [Lasiosphaeria miniovina]|uniref:Uncharacterized protein n=1 Tax=Lasiosphaeria miniovina TaxID=1954250 RepID=A0AA39ZYZ6_9PEZI|nr:uncharacterized protein B0T26DRAFT_788870 [Lasiosphaeria miniovina]KAK0706208.1 hypothetical protein B0T26DRAFT_788870 [Lasiosphaeria miniovina]
MSELQREHDDVESAPFLDDEVKEMYSSTNETREKNLLPSQSIFSEVSTKLVTFQPDESYNDDPLGPDGLLSPWSKLSPPGKGHVRVDDPSAWKLSGGYPLNDPAHSAAEEYTVSVFHQVHCLAAIKSKVSKLQDWYHGENDKEYLAFALSQEHMRDDHIYHCIDYIRQAIVCCGDTTLEKSRTVDGKIVQGVDGWGVEHQCRDFKAIFAYGEAHRTNNDTGID